MAVPPTAARDGPQSPTNDKQQQEPAKDDNRKCNNRLLATCRALMNELGLNGFHHGQDPGTRPGPQGRTPGPGPALRCPETLPWVSASGYPDSYLVLASTHSVQTLHY